MKLKRKDIISGNAKVVRSVNRAMILNIIREMQPISRVKISGLTKLNKSTVSSIVADLLDEGIIYEKVNQDKNVGRNPINLHLQLGKFFVGAINIDSALTHLAIADIDGSLIDNTTIETQPQNPDKFVEVCVLKLFAMRDRLNIDHFEGIGVSIAGIVDSNELVVKFAPNIGWSDFDIGRTIKRLCSEEGIIAIENDAKASASAEQWFGNHKINLENFVFLSVGAGIGTGIVVENQILNGEFKASGEFGHITLIDGGELCPCGNYGCWEAYASDRATVKRYNLRKGFKSDGSVSQKMQEILDLAQNNDKDALEILRQTGQYLGQGISNIIMALDPEAIIIGGRITQVWDIIYPEMMETITKRAFFGRSRNIHILPTSLAVPPRLLGAATLAIKEIFNDLKITR